MPPIEVETHVKPEKSILLRASAAIFIFLLGAKILNFFKKILIGQLFGVSSVADAFFAASYLPYYLAIFFEGMLFLVFLPLFSEIRSEKGEDLAKQFAGQIFFTVFCVTGATAILFWLAAPRAVQELVPGFTSEEKQMTLSLLRIMCGVIVLGSMGAFFRALNSYFGKYLVAASSGMVDTLVMILVIFLTWKVWGIQGAAWGAVIGALAAVSFQYAYLIRVYKLHPVAFTLKREWARRLGFMLIPLGVIWFFQQIPMMLINRFGSGMWEGTISAMNIAHTLTTVPMGLVSHTVLLAVFPAMAKQANASSQERACNTFFQTLRSAFLILMPIGVLLSVLSKPVTILFFSGGEVSAEGTKRIADALFCLGWSIFALYADLFMTQSLIAMRKVKAAIFLCATRAGLTYGFCYVLSSAWDYLGLALGFSMALIINFFISFPLVLKFSPLVKRWREIFLYSGKLAVAMTPLFFFGWYFQNQAIETWLGFSLPALIGILVVVTVLSLGAYLMGGSVLRVEEVHHLFEWFWRKWTLRGKTLSARVELVSASDKLEFIKQQELDYSLQCEDHS